MARLTFLREFLLRPTSLGSVTPSSPALASRVVDLADLGPGNIVVELGAGTGPITEVLVRRHPDAQLLAFEPNPSLAKVFRQRLPGVALREARAGADLGTVVQRWAGRPADVVVSGLPWTMWEEELQRQVLAGIVGALGPRGRFLTYTYVSSHAGPAGARFRRVLGEHFDLVWSSQVVWSNLPPAVILVGDRPRR